MNYSCTQSGYRIKNQHFFASPQLFQYPAKHKNAEHIEKNMTPVGMHKHVGNHLMGFEQR